MLSSARHIIDALLPPEQGVAAPDDEVKTVPMAPTARPEQPGAIPFQVYGKDGKVVWGKAHDRPQSTRTGGLEGTTSNGLLWTDRKLLAFWQPSEDKFPESKPGGSRPVVSGVPPADVNLLIASAKKEKGVELLPCRISFTDTPPGSKLTVAQWLEGTKSNASAPDKKPDKMHFKLRRLSEVLPVPAAVLRPKLTESAEIVAAIKNLEHTLADLAARPAPEVNVNPEITIESPPPPRKWRVIVTQRDNSEERRIQTLTIEAAD